MISISDCRKILQENSNNSYSDEQILAVRNGLYGLAELVVEKAKGRNNNFAVDVSSGLKENGIRLPRVGTSGGEYHGPKER